MASLVVLETLVLHVCQIAGCGDHDLTSSWVSMSCGFFIGSMCRHPSSHTCCTTWVVLILCFSFFPLYGSLLFFLVRWSL